jgi:hypothetical protein
MEAQIRGHQDATETDLEQRRMEQDAALELHRIETQAEVQRDSARMNAEAAKAKAAAKPKAKNG